MLVAYPYWGDKVTQTLRRMPHDDYRLIVDSGAFTAWNTGKVIELDDYCRFLDTLEEFRPFQAVQLDVFGSPEGTYKNLQIMKARGYDVMPVFTRGDTLERLEEFYEMAETIMFGGIVIGGKNREYVKWFLNRNNQRKAHWLGFVNIPFIRKYRPVSVDSSSACGAARYGRIEIWDGKYGFIRADRKDFINRPDPALVQAMVAVGAPLHVIKRLGHTSAWRASGKFGDITNRETNDFHASAQFVSLLSHIHRAQKVERDFGTHLYLAVGVSWFEAMVDGFYYHRKHHAGFSL